VLYGGFSGLYKRRIPLFLYGYKHQALFVSVLLLKVLVLHIDHAVCSVDCTVQTFVVSKIKEMNTFILK